MELTIVIIYETHNYNAIIPWSSDFTTQKINHFSHKFNVMKSSRFLEPWEDWKQVEADKF